MLKRTLAFLFLLALAFPVLGDDSEDFGLGKRLLVLNPLVSNIELTDVEKRLISKVMIKVCAKQEGYQVALGEIGIARDAGLGISNVELSVLKDGASINVKAILLDEIKKQVLGKFEAKGIERLHLLRTVETAMDTIFISYQKK